MDERSYGVIISVANLDEARDFYEDILDFGPPVVDSNHWVEFQLDNGLVLGLRAQPKADEDLSCSILWVYYTEKFDVVSQNLAKNEVEPLKTSAPPVGLQAEVYADPEGNRFVLAQKP